MKTLAIILLSASCAWSCQLGWIPTPEGVCQEVGASVKPSDDIAPQTGMPAWQDPGIHIVEIESMATADAHHPATCAKECVWTGVRCLCNENPMAAKKP